MKYNSRFAEVAFASALALNVANAEANYGAGISTGMMFGMAARSSSSGTQSDYTPPSIKSLGNRISIQGNIPHVKACLEQLGVEEKPLPQMHATDAQNIVDCVDQKTIDQFLAKPTQYKKEISNLVWENKRYAHTSLEFTGDPSFASQVARECNSSGKTSLGEFEVCAGDVFKSNRYKLMSDIFMALGGLGALGFVAYRVTKGRKEGIDHRPS